MVAFGAGVFSSSSRGHVPRLVKGVRRILREQSIEVHDVNGGYRSKLCNSQHKTIKAL
jgi:hypothetical protein